MFGFSSVALSAGLLWSSHSHYRTKNRPIHQNFTGRAWWTLCCYCRHKKKKNLQAVILLEVSLTAFPSLWGAKEQNSGVGFFSSSFFWRKGENCVDFGFSLVSLHHRSKGSSDFYRAHGWHFDFGSVPLTLMSTPCNFPKKALTGQGGMCNIYCIFLTVLFMSSGVTT